MSASADLTLAGLSIWAVERQFPNAVAEWDADWMAMRPYPGTFPFDDTARPAGLSTAHLAPTCPPGTDFRACACRRLRRPRDIPSPPARSPHRLADRDAQTGPHRKRPRR